MEITWDIQYWEEAEFGRDGIDVYGVLCGTYEEACIVAGCDTPDQIDAEEKARFEEECEEEQDAIEARQGPAYYFPAPDINIPF